MNFIYGVLVCVFIWAVFLNHPKPKADPQLVEAHEIAEQAFNKAAALEARVDKLEATQRAQRNGY